MAVLRSSVVAIMLYAAAACAPAIATAPAPAPTTATRPAAAAVDIPQAEYAARRQALAQRIGDGVVIAYGSSEPAADYLKFFQNSHFRYLTGITEPEARLVMVVRGGTPTPLLFVRERDLEREVWEGYRLGTAGAARLTGMPARAVDDFARVRDSLLQGASRVFVIAGTDAPRDHLSPAASFIAELRDRGGIEVRSASDFVSLLRADKSATELELIRRAVQITVAAHAAAARMIAPGRYEYEAEAAIEHAFRAAGAERPAFASIVGSGPNSTVLHYWQNDRQMLAGDVVVADIGASWRGYAGDVTRTYPVSGRFTAEQREIYQIVRDAQAAAEGVAALGVRAAAMSTAADEVIKQGLARLGLIEAPDAMYECDGLGSSCPQYRLYYMHGLGHGIGLDVHDPGTAPNSRGGPLEPGDTFSIEPGIYVRRNLLEAIPSTPRNDQLKERIRAAVARYADIGVRIEDDYIMTATGLEWISPAPREIPDVEAAMR
jgi:Xaa-Pro aminopeptidase